MKLEEMTPTDLEQELYNLAHKAYETSKAYIKAKEEYDILEDNKKSIFAVIIDAQIEKSHAAKTNSALQSGEWMEHLEGLKHARRNYLSAKVENDNAIRMWDTLRSIMSSRNTERRTNT